MHLCFSRHSVFCDCYDITLNSFVAGGHFGHAVRCRMVTVIEKACQIVKDKGNLSLLDVKCSVYGKGHTHCIFKIF